MMSRGSGFGIPGTSVLLSSKGFAGALDRILGQQESVIDTIDGSLEVFDYGKMKTYFDVAVVLTDLQLLGIRGGGLLGPKKPFIASLKQIDRVGVTRQHNVDIQWTGDYGTPQLWKLHVGDEALADRWMRQILDATALVNNPAATERAPAPFREREFSECRARLQVFVDSLAGLTSRANCGQPFGEGFGLEGAMQWALNSFVDADDTAAGMHDDRHRPLGAAASDGIGPAELDDVMGVYALHPNSVNPEALEAVTNLAEAAKGFLGQFDEPGERMWELWKKNDEVALEFLCWLTVARLRLVAVADAITLNA